MFQVDRGCAAGSTRGKKLETLLLCIKVLPFLYMTLLSLPFGTSPSIIPKANNRSSGLSQPERSGIMEIAREDCPDSETHFTQLPPELRVMVYRYLVDDPRYLKTRIQPNADRTKSRAPRAYFGATVNLILVTFSLPVSILVTCHLVHNEALPIFQTALQTLLSQPARLVVELGDYRLTDTDIRWLVDSFQRCTSSSSNAAPESIHNSTRDKLRRRPRHQHPRLTNDFQIAKIEVFSKQLARRARNSPTTTLDIVTVSVLVSSDHGGFVTISNALSILDVWTILADLDISATLRLREGMWSRLNEAQKRQWAALCQTELNNKFQVISDSLVDCEEWERNWSYDERKAK